MARGKKAIGLFNYDNVEKRNKNFMYLNLKSSKCYNCNFSGSNFDYVNFRGAHLKKCSFQESSFKGAEFIGSNLKGSKFKKAKFENAIFEGANLDGVNFEGAEFSNTIFVECKFENVREFDFVNDGVRIFDEMPQINISDDLEKALNCIMENEYVKRSRVFDTREGKINHVTVMLLLEQFHEESLIERLNIIKSEINKDFYTLSYVIKLLEKAK